MFADFSRDDGRQSAAPGEFHGRALGSPVSLDYRDRAPFPFTAGNIKGVHIAYTP